jgi:hypothetical protein
MCQLTHRPSHLAGKRLLERYGAERGRGVDRVFEARAYRTRRLQRTGFRPFALHVMTDQDWPFGDTHRAASL